MNISKINNYKPWLLKDLLKMNNGREFFEEISRNFISKNIDVENFLKRSSIQSTLLRQTATYPVFEKKDFVGYFTLAIKTVVLNSSSFSSKEKSKLERFSKLDSENKTYTVPAILLAQFSRNFSESSKSISGKLLMEIAFNQIQEIQDRAGGSLMFLECENIPSLIKFYESCGFKMLDSTRITDNENELLQMFKLN